MDLRGVLGESVTISYAGQSLTRRKYDQGSKIVIRKVVERISQNMMQPLQVSSFSGIYPYL